MSAEASDGVTAAAAGASRPVVVVVGSKSKPKVEAARAGFARLLPPDTKLEVLGVDAPSGVAAQPHGEETRLGARNRLAAARGTEAGAMADFCIAFEGGVEQDTGGRLVCFAVVCVQLRDDDYVSEVRSASHSLPPGIEALMREEGLEQGLATDRFFADRIAGGYGKDVGGTIGALTYGVIDRVEFYSHPAALALVPFVNAAAYGVKTGNPLDR